MIQKLLILFCTLSSSFAWSQISNGIPYLQKEDSLESESILLSTHPTLKWDADAQIKSTVNHHIKNFKNAQLPVVCLVHAKDEETLSGYYLEESPTHLIHSYSGDHEIPISSQNYVITGNYFNQCVGSTVRDLILFSNNKESDEPIRITFLTDSILHGSFNVIKPLFHFLVFMSNDEMAFYIIETFFEWGSLGHQHYVFDKKGQARFERYANIEDFTFQIQRDGEEIGSYGHGEKTVILDFLICKDLEFSKSGFVGRDLICTMRGFRNFAGVLVEYHQTFIGLLVMKILARRMHY